MPQEDRLEKYLATKSDRTPEPKKTEKTVTIPERIPWKKRPVFWSVLGALSCVGVMFCLGGDDADAQELRQALQKEQGKVRYLLEKQALLKNALQEYELAAVSAKTTDMPPPPGITPLPPDLANDPNAVKLLYPDEEGWRERYEYARLKYNKVVADYNKLRKEYIKVMGKAGRQGGKLVTAAQFYHALRNDTKAESRKLDDKYNRGRLRHDELKELEAARDEIRHRDLWLRKMANKFRVAD